jgi:hypothetical protein
VTGPENYKAAEKLAGPTGEWYYANPADVPAILARAQVHATLALAAATAMASIDRMPDEDYAAWDKVAGVPTRTEDE